MSADPLELHQRPLRESLTYIVREAIPRDFKPDMIVALQLATVEDRIRKMPEEHTPPSTNGSIDWGRGYSAAIKDVLALLG